MINPRFQGVVHVNNNGKSIRNISMELLCVLCNVARLAWDNAQGMQQQHCPINPWSSGGMGPPMQPPPSIPMQPIQHFSDHPQNMQIGPGQPLQFIPPSQQTFVSQPIPQVMNQHSPMQVCYYNYLIYMYKGIFFLIFLFYYSLFKIHFIGIGQIIITHQCR